ncbi:hypothetical protein EV702DRAFT_523898 [Suillus placidus]|uniref:Uncharacterized protein n=1 Tax=Suillus placidus TaxID=48579 RepID=A0A9P6ZPP7_9AGAM|nr:hypothetical protein EV702DRAFT_523898 [Suillus placidus]
MGFVPRTPVLVVVRCHAVVRCYLAVVRCHLAVVRCYLVLYAATSLYVFHLVTTPAQLYMHIPLPTSLYPYTRLHSICTYFATATSRHLRITRVHQRCFNLLV